MIEQKIKIGIIGTGNMGSAIIRGITSEKTKEMIIATDIDNAKLTGISREAGINITQSLDEVKNFSDIIIVSVKPDVAVTLSSSLKDYKGIIVSIAAGISLKTLLSQAGSDKKIIRAMPNTPVTTGAGMIVISPSEKISEDDISIVKSIFASIGAVLVMDEKYMNAVTAVSGSGPAYVFTFIQGMADAGVKLGIPRNEALILAGQTIFGSAKMFLDKLENPIFLRDKVTSPGGTTITALHVLERAGFNGIIIDAIEAAAKRSKELDKS
jgi:pyrroline-5-carboxylate reductase